MFIAKITNWSCIALEALDNRVIRNNKAPDEKASGALLIYKSEFYFKSSTAALILLKASSI